jgi:hypothetical protein
LKRSTFFFDRAADHVGLADEMRAIFRSSYRELTVQVPVRMDDGHLEVFTGYRVQHTMQRAARTRAAFATTLTRTSTTYVRWRRS